MTKILCETQGSQGWKSFNTSPIITATSDPGWKETKDTSSWKGNEKNPLKLSEEILTRHKSIEGN